ncbi:MAG: aldolase [Acidimicrobiia bacterium]
MRLDDPTFADLIDVRVHDPERIADALAARSRRSSPTRGGMMFIVAADHTARGMVGLGADPLAMADRRSMLDRLLTALEHPRVDGVLASADIMEDLVLLGALEDRVAVGTMNRGGLSGASWELDDRFTAYDTQHLVAANLDAGKLLLRLDDDDPGTVSTLHAASRAVQELNDQRMIAMVEPIPYTKDANGRAVWDHGEHKLVRAVGISAALGGSSAYTWLKIQATADIAAVAAMTTQPLLLLGGSPGPDPDVTFAMWERALHEPTVRGLVVGRALLYPPDGDVAAAVGRAAALVESAVNDRSGEPSRTGGSTD